MELAAASEKWVNLRSSGETIFLTMIMRLNHLEDKRTFTSTQLHSHSLSLIFIVCDEGSTFISSTVYQSHYEAKY